MRKLYTGICCFLLLAVGIAPAPGDAQTYGAEFLKSRAYSEDPDMGWNKGRTWRELMAEYQNSPTMGAGSTTAAQTQTYRLAKLDNDLTSRAIAWEKIKGSLVDDLIDRITTEAKASSGGVSKKIYGESGGIAYELLPDREDIQVILPSLILVEKTGEDLQKGILILKAKTQFTFGRIVPMIVAIRNEPTAYSEISGVRGMATDAMKEIVQIQAAAAGSGQKGSLNQRYTDAVNRLIAADKLEKGRYFALHGQTQEAVDAYTRALEALPGLAIAYRNRGGIHLHLEQYAKAMEDFLKAYTSDAIDHTESRNFQACIDDTDAALKLFEDYATAYYQRAVCRFGLGQQAGAMDDFKRAAQLGENRAQSLLTSRNIKW